MIYQVYAIRDNKSEFLSPSVDINDETAKRNFAMAMSRHDSTLNFAPADFDLYRIGTYDAKMAKLTPVTPEFLAHGLDFV